MKNSVNDTINWKINSHLSQVIVVPRHSEYMLTDRTILLHLAAVELIYWRLHISQSGHLLEILTSTPGTSHMLHDVQNIIEVPVLSRKAWHTKLSSGHQLCSARCSQHLALLLQRVCHLEVLLGRNFFVQQ